MVLMIAMVGLVIDGGYAWGQQRATQNATDATAEAGAVVLVQALAGVTVTDDDVWASVSSSPPRTAIRPSIPRRIAWVVRLRQGRSGICAYYTDIDGNMLDHAGAPYAVGTLSGAAPPTGAAGVVAKAQKKIDTFLARVIGINTFNITAPPPPWPATSGASATPPLAVRCSP